MPNNKLILGILALAIVFGATNPGQAQEETNPSTLEQTPIVAQTQVPEVAAQVPVKQPPIVIEGDQLSFSEETGDIFANGKVVITNQGQRVESEHFEGNTKLSEVWTNVPATFFMPGTEITGTYTLYNYKLKTGSMDKAKGRLENEFVSGENISMFPDKYIINNGTMTKCPAQVPDYHISADKIEIWPNDKLIAYNAKFWIGKTVIFAMPKYQQSIAPGAGESAFPRIGYDSDDGFYIRQHLNYPLNNKLSAYVNLDYYTKSNFKPSYGLVQRESKFTLRVDQGYFQDSDDNWIKKEPEINFVYSPQRIGNLPVKYNITAIYGKWTDDYKTSWHQDYRLYFRHDPIKLSDTVTLNLGTGIRQVRESYNDSTKNITRYDATVAKEWSDSLNTWVGYHYIKNNATLFEYDSDSLSRELNTGFTYKIDKMNTIQVKHRYDLDRSRTKDLDYVWYRNLHCWDAKITYRAERDQIKFDITTTHW